MNEPCVYEIRVRGTLPERWSSWFDGLEIQPTPEGETLLKGGLIDQSALISILGKMHNLNLTIISVQRTEVW